MAKDPGMQGRSLWPTLIGSAAQTPREDVYCEFLGANPRRGGAAPRFATMVRTATHKLVRVHDRNEGELYDLIADPGEHKNLWADPKYLELKCSYSLGRRTIPGFSV
jgi:hypothetical protein